jgi:hypothetical protein
MMYPTCVTCNATFEMVESFNSHKCSDFLPTIYIGNPSNITYSPPVVQANRALTLTTDSKERKEYPIVQGCLRYFPAALAGVARISKIGNDKHNPGLELYHARGKSMDHSDCLLRHLIDLEDLLVALNNGTIGVSKQNVLDEVSSVAWRALALSQELHESFGAPLAPGAKLDKS